MTDRDAFLRTIIANPSEDGPRLVFADWLEENGESERGEFIRVQIELAERLAKLPRLVESSSITGSLRDWEVHVPGVVDVKAGDRITVRQIAGPHPHAIGEVWLDDARVLEVSIDTSMRREIVTRLVVTVAREITGDGPPKRWAAVEVLRARERELITYKNMFECGLMDGRPVAAVAYDQIPTIEECRGVATGFVCRGFIEHLICSWSAWAAHADAIRRATPLRTVRLTTPPEIGRAAPGFGGPDGRHLVFMLADMAVEVPPSRLGPGRTPEWMASVLALRWPGITFTLPASSLRTTPMGGVFMANDVRVEYATVFDGAAIYRVTSARPEPLTISAEMGAGPTAMFPLTPSGTHHVSAVWESPGGAIVLAPGTALVARTLDGSEVMRFGWPLQVVGIPSIGEPVEIEATWAEFAV